MKVEPKTFTSTPFAICPECRETALDNNSPSHIKKFHAQCHQAAMDLFLKTNDESPSSSPPSLAELDPDPEDNVDAGDSSFELSIDTLNNEQRQMLNEIFDHIEFTLNCDIILLLLK